MNIVTTISELRNILDAYKSQNKSIAFVPTMGALHNGHISLLKHAKKNHDVTVCSIFINRIQFNNPEDYSNYPKNTEQDILMLEKEHCDIVFLPEEKEMYAGMQPISVDIGILGEIMEARYRPGHFEGVAQIVYRFFEIIKPDVAYFGQKDLQQFKVIETMNRQYNMGIQLVMCPIIREDDGLAMSSRNIRLSDQYRPIAAKIYAALSLAGDLLQFGNNIEQVKQKISAFLSRFPPLELEYFEIADYETLQPLTSVQGINRLTLCIAVYMEGVRLIDNIIIIS